MLTGFGNRCLLIVIRFRPPLSPPSQGGELVDLVFKPHQRASPLERELRGVFILSGSNAPASEPISLPPLSPPILGGELADLTLSLINALSLPWRGLRGGFFFN